MDEETKPLYLMFKMASGSPFIIAEVVEETSHELRTRFPLIFSFHDAADGEVFVNASKFMHFAENDVVAFDKRNLYALATPKQNLLQYYVGWREGVEASKFEKVEAMMLNAAFDPTLDDSHASEFELEALEPTANTVFH